MKKILVIDDDRDISDIVTIVLERQGYEVHTHFTGLGIPQLVLSFGPDVILLDINLPGKLGTEVCDELREVSPLPPIIYFSAHAHKDASYLLCEADAFIQKPFEVQELLKVIKEFSNKVSLNKAATRIY